MMAAWVSARRPPEVVQTSALDCGPAALAALLQGLGAPGSYSVLREVCATDVDGTSIDAMEEVAQAAGVDAVQLVVPAEHVLAFPEEYLPAIAVTVLPDGFAHFVVLWRCGRRRVMVMDPASGRRRVGRRALVDELYRHRTVVPAEAWREWAGSEVFTTALLRRMTAVGISAGEGMGLVREALADPGVGGLGDLDAAVRVEERRSGHRSARSRVEAMIDAGPAVEDRSCVPVLEAGRPDIDGAETVALHGAVIVRARSWNCADGDPELLVRLDVPEPGPWAALGRLTHRPVATAAAVAAMGALVAAGAVGELIVLQPFAGGDGVTPHPLLALFAVAASAVAAVVAAVLAWRVGRRTEVAACRAWWRATALLPQAFVRTRPMSDLAQRGHLLHRLREVPVHALQITVAATLAVAATITMLIAAPRTAPGAAVLLAVTIGGPVLGVRRAAEVDLRAGTLAGCLSHFIVDSLLGAQVTATGSMANALRHDYERTLGAWRRAGRSLVSLSAWIRVGSGLPGALAAAWCTVAAGGEDPGRTLLVAGAALLVIDAGSALADRLRAAPAVRSVAARAAGPLVASGVLGDVAAESPGSMSDGPACPVASRRPAPAALRFEKVSVTAGTVALLEDVNLEVPAGAHVAVIGPSGAGKSTLLAVALGLLEPTSGRVTRIAGAADGGAAWSGPGTRLWNDTLEANLAYGAAFDAPADAVRLADAEATDVGCRLAARSDRRLGDGGGRLSDGEAQRVRLARALGRPGSRLVVLDEAFRGLERDRRRRMLDRARDRWREATLLCALHDVDDTIDFDHVVILDGGRIVETGNPGVLAADADSIYRRMLDAAARPTAPGWNLVEVEYPGPTDPTAPFTAVMEAEEPARGHSIPRLPWGWLIASIGANIGAVALIVLAFRALGASLFDRGAVPGWPVLAGALGGAVIIGAAAAWCGGRFAVEVGTAYRRSVLERALAVDPDQARGLGVGRALAVALDTDLVGSFLIATAPAAALGLVEVVAALVLADAGGHGAAVKAALGATLLIGGTLAAALLRFRTRWTRARTEFTGRLVERLAGIDTVHIQDDPDRTRTEGDRRLDVQERAGRAMDRVAAALAATPAVGTVALLAVALLAADGPLDGSSTATGIGLALLAGAGLERLTSAAAELVGAIEANRGVRALESIARIRPTPSPQKEVAATAAQDQATLIDARGVTATFHSGHGGLTRPTDLTIRAGDRLLLTGPSGSGKTTLAQILTGERNPTTGHIALTDHIKVVRVPSPGDDHLFQASLLFNIIAPRAWPPSDADLNRAEAIIEELQLGPLLRRMPTGISQPVGEGGWRLSSGEAARVSLARAIAQEPDVLILDETTATLDATSRHLILSVAQRNCKAIVLIAHP